MESCGDCHSEIYPPHLPRGIASSLQQTPLLHKASNFANSSEHSQDFDRILKSQLGIMYVGLSHLRSTFFGGVCGLQTGSEPVFQRCTGDRNALFVNGWTGWPDNANQGGVLSWFAGLSEKLAKFSADYDPLSAVAEGEYHPPAS
ncbi:hypothetical protein PEX1_010440 [Penicillium expansum]|uniref:Uncharacterized protein n=1 Tax=Penicillium expansum TaxID=27334 RepID=A0A0A2JZD0_PENEN|nr:hypothetical protein PEX2_100440 [Penicillium expansum]KGO36751.1 hypothetical protein PEXP_005500 [Penicillium expansum]KGO60779.1 hypothetical protein PEX2_100440 [Penicillium expansum]KGO69366.1 hypothetical protein PEX1_010440 [Penicillium expansum]